MQPTPAKQVRTTPCNLCSAPIELTLENPRRVCAACGSVNLPTDSHEAPQPLGLPSSLRKKWAKRFDPNGFGPGSGPKWRAHALVLAVQFVIVVGGAWTLGGGSGGKYGFGPVFAGIAAMAFFVYAALLIVPVYFLGKPRHVVTLDVTVMVLVAGFFAVSMSPRRSSAPPPRPEPPPVARVQPPAPPRPPVAARSIAPASPGWEGSRLLADFSVTQEGNDLRVRFVPRFTGKLAVRTRHSQLADSGYSRASCPCTIDQPAECTLSQSKPTSPSSVVYEVFAEEGSTGLVVVSVDASGHGAPRRNRP